MSGLNRIISSTVLFIFSLILNMFNSTLVKPIYVISLRSKIELIPIDFKYEPPTLKYSISEFFFLTPLSQMPLIYPQKFHLLK